MPERISLDEVLKELSSLANEAEQGPDGFTSDELARHMNVCHRHATQRIKDWVAAGHLVYAGKRRVVNITGGHNAVPVYRVQRG